MTDGGGNAHPRDMWQFELTDSGTINLLRGRTGQELSYRYFVVELPAGSGTPPPPATVDGFTAAPPTVTAGESTSLTWTTTNATGVSINGGATLPADGSTTVSPTTTTTYTLTAVGAGGNATSTVTVTVNLPPAATVDSFTAASTTIAAGQSTNLTWTTTNATGVSIDSGATLPADGSTTVSPTTTTTYTVTAFSAGGDATSTVTVTVIQPPAATVDSFTAASPTITAGQSTSLTWAATNATGVSINGGATLPADGSTTVSPTTTTTYTLTAIGAGGNATSTVTVTVNQPPNVNPVASFSVSTNDLTATFTDGSSDADGNVVARSWNFGDGGTSTALNPTHSYATAGTYSVSMTVTDDRGGINATSQPVTVSVAPPPPAAQGTVSISGPTSIDRGDRTSYTVTLTNTNKH
jgi:hypothetical protein